MFFATCGVANICCFYLHCIFLPIQSQNELDKLNVFYWLLAYYVSFLFLFPQRDFNLLAGSCQGYATSYKIAYTIFLSVLSHDETKSYKKNEAKENSIT